eukprot:6203216-Pleurochrysis_carterae.AAC.1
MRVESSVIAYAGRTSVRETTYVLMYVRDVPASVCERVRASARACARACVRACVCVVCERVRA